MRTRPRWRARVAAVAIGSALVVGAGLPAGAGDGGDGAGGYVGGANDGTDVTGTAGDSGPRQAGTSRRVGSSQPNCTMSDGTPAYYRYEGLQYTTMDEQRTEIRPEEQRPGVYLHRYCGGEYVDFQFYPEAEPVDPWALARQVVITPPTPVLRTSPPAGDHLVDVVSWFWVDAWESLGEQVTAGSVTVNVYATPVSVEIDPGDGSVPFTCSGRPPAYTQGADPAGACTHTYQTAGEYEATATVIYATGFWSNVGVAGDLGTVEPTGGAELAVREAQAVVTG